MSRIRAFRPALALIWGLLIAGAASADVSFVSRDLSVRIDGSAPDFSDVTGLKFKSTYGVGAGSSGSRSFQSTPFPPFVSTTSSTTGAVSLTGVITTPEVFSATVNATGPEGGSFTFETIYSVIDGPEGVAPLFRYLRTGDAIYAPTPFTNPDLTALELYLPVGALVDAGNPFSISASIAGDYSTGAGPDSGTGQSWLAYLDPAWTVTQNFVYDPLTNLTTFSCLNPSYDPDPNGPHYSPYLDIYFVGAPAAAVPEPAGWLSMGAGLALVGALRRRQRRPVCRDESPDA